MSVVQAILLGILGGIAISDSRVFGMMMLDRPLILGPLVGLILGDFHTGIIMGASIELVMMGVVGIGSATPPDTVSGAILATAFAISSHLDVSAAVALALPIATLGQVVGTLVRTGNAYFVHKADKAADNGDYSGVEKCLWGGAALFFAAYFILVFAGSYLGSNVIKQFVDMLPASVTKGFSVASNMLPALGVGILMQLLFNKKNVAFFFVGWALTELIGVSTIGTAVIGVTIAYIMYQYMSKGNKAETAASPVKSDDLGGEL